MYEIRCQRPEEARKVFEILEDRLRESRFYLSEGISIGSYKGQAVVVQLRGVRLQESKAYCGNHAFDCALVNPGRSEKHRKKRNYLEGSDWVAFNDMVNDVLDRLKYSALVQSTLVTVRVGYERCVEYYGDVDRGGEWCRRGRYENWCGHKAPRSTFPDGTPGIARWKPKKGTLAHG